MLNVIINLYSHTLTSLPLLHTPVLVVLQGPNPVRQSEKTVKYYCGKMNEQYSPQSTILSAVATSCRRVSPELKGKEKMVKTLLLFLYS